MTEPSSGPVALKYPRLVLKLSGAAFAGEESFGIAWPELRRIAHEIHAVAETGAQVAVVVGGGNFWRGKTAAQEGMDRGAADYVGMVATVINCLALQQALEDLGADTRVQTAIEMRAVAEPFIRRRAIRHLEKGRIVIFGGGSGNPFVTTDTAAVLRANEIGGRVIMKATNVDGVYNGNPYKDPTAKLLKHVTYDQALNQRLGVMDATAIAMAREYDLPIIVFNIKVPGNIIRAALGEDIGTLVNNGGTA
ncbi:MAG: UMP kinase [Candidatus Zipacnadales bacterium]